MSEESLQERYAPQNACFGCGPANTKGLRIRSFARSDDECVCSWTPSDHHEAFPGVLNGGIIGALLDCHMNWTAIWHLLQKQGGGSAAPCCVTAKFAVKFKRPTPSDGPIELRAWIVESFPDRAKVEATLSAGGEVCATGSGTFVAVKPDHPAHHRW